MNEVLEKGKQEIENMIYEVRGKQVMLDSDLAKLYQCKNGTKDVNKAVNRNIERFPKDFYFQLTKEEYDNLKFQNGTSRLSSHGGIRKIPYVFTEQGVAMLASVLRTSVASLVSVDIMRAFVVMKKYISKTLLEQTCINELVLKNSKRIDMLEEAFSGFQDKTNHLFFDGQVYDAYSLMMRIFDHAKEEIIIIDNYIDRKILDIISKTEKKITIITNKYNNADYTKYKKQYHNINLVISNHFHDRFIIIDKKVLYHCGASFKDLGKKCFAITKMADEKYLLELLHLIKQENNF